MFFFVEIFMILNSCSQVISKSKKQNNLKHFFQKKNQKAIFKIPRQTKKKSLTKKAAIKNLYLLFQKLPTSFRNKTFPRCQPKLSFMRFDPSTTPNRFQFKKSREKIRNWKLFSNSYHLSELKEFLSFASPWKLLLYQLKPDIKSWSEQFSISICLESR